MARSDFSQPGKRTPTTGARSKKAKRRAIERHAVHLKKEQQARKARASRIKRDRARRAEGWWPPQ